MSRLIEHSPHRWNESKLVFEGKNRLLSGFIGSTKEVVEFSSGGADLSFPVGTKFLSLHFSASPVNIQNGEFTGVASVVLSAMDEMVFLSEELRSEEIPPDIELIGGITNPRLARFASRKLGFHLADAPIYGQAVSRFFPRVGVFMTRSELLENAVTLREERIRIGQRLEHRATFPSQQL